jgi:hypothetical protein
MYVMHGVLWVQQSTLSLVLSTLRVLTSPLLFALLLLQENMGWVTDSTASHTLPLQDMQQAALNDAAFETLWNQQVQQLGRADQLGPLVKAELGHVADQLSRHLLEQQQVELFRRQDLLEELCCVTM